MNKTIVTEYITFLGAIFTCFIFLYMRINALDDKIYQLSVEQSQRTDKLYEMFIDLLKEQRG